MASVDVMMAAGGGAVELWWAGGVLAMIGAGASRTMVVEVLVVAVWDCWSIAD